VCLICDWLNALESSRYLWELRVSPRTVRIDASQKNSILDASIRSPIASTKSFRWLDRVDSEDCVWAESLLAPESTIVHTCAVGFEKCRFEELFLPWILISLMELKLDHVSLINCVVLEASHGK
jgi:hypothetical protein